MQKNRASVSESEEVMRQKAAVHHAWYVLNRESQLLKAKQRRQADPEKYRAIGKASYLLCRRKKLDKIKEARKADPEKYREINRAFYARFREYIILKNTLWARENREKVRTICRRRYAQLPDSVILAQLTQDGRLTRDQAKPLIELKRLHLKIKREIRSKK